MKNRKARVKKQHPFYEGNKCWYFDGYDINNKPITECFKPWSYLCDGNQHNCKHLKMKFLASLSEKKRQNYLNKYDYD